MGFEGVAEVIGAGVARGRGDLGQTGGRIAEQFPGAGEPEYVQVLVEGHAHVRGEEPGKIRRTGAQGRGHALQAHGLRAMLAQVVEHRLHQLLGVAAGSRRRRGGRRLRNASVKLRAQMGEFALVVFQLPPGTLQLALRRFAANGRLQIVPDHPSKAAARFKVAAGTTGGPAA